MRFKAGRSYVCLIIYLDLFLAVDVTAVRGLIFPRVIIGVDREDLQAKLEASNCTADTADTADTAECALTIGQLWLEL